jgi:S-adenosylmethionine/arginine decarboxylase-like enzyme
METWKDKYWGLLSSVDCYGCNPGLVRSYEAIKIYVCDLCDLIEMKRFGETQVVHFGEDEKIAGYSMLQLIETSLISGHFANESNAAYIDIFSCKYYDPNTVAEFTKYYFRAEKYVLNTTVRK